MIVSGWMSVSGRVELRVESLGGRFILMAEGYILGDEFYSVATDLIRPQRKTNAI